MKPRLALMVALAALVAVPAGAPWPAAAQGDRGVAMPSSARLPAETQARVIVKFRADGALAREAIARAGPRAGVRAQHAARLSQRLGLDLRDGIAVAPRVQVLKARGLSSAELAARLAKDPDVEYAEVDQRVRIAAAPNDPFYALGLTGTMPWAGQWYLRAPGEAVVQWSAAGGYAADASRRVVSAINAEGAWNLSAGSAAIAVAVLDTGVRLEHPDLAGKLLPGRDFVSEDGTNEFTTANDGDGWDADPSDPGDWITLSEDSSGTLAGCGVADSSWHGTQVAGLIGAATDNAAGMAGSGRNVRILPVRVLGKCGGYQSDIAAGMRWAAGLSHPDLTGVPANPNPARVVNLSLGSVGACGATYSDAVRELTAAGVAVVVAAGNEDGFAVNRPANCEGAIGVAGIRHSGTKVGYSSVGPELTLAAPAGNCIYLGFGEPCVYPLLTTINTGTTVPVDSGYSDSFSTETYGTSFAAPLVAGTVALMMSVDPAATPAQIKQRLQASARPFPSTGADPGVTNCRAPDSSRQLECYCTTTTCGAGMLDAAAAVAASVPGYTVVINQTTAAPVAVQPASFNAAGTSLPAGRGIAAYEWSVSPGATGAQIVGPANGDTVIVQAQAAGSYALSLAVTADNGAVARASRTVQVAGGPTAVVSTRPASPRAGQAVTLDGSGSSAGSGLTITAYQWAITQGAGIATITSGATSASATVTTSAAGSFTVTLTVSDSAGQSGTGSSTVTVAAASSGGGGGGAMGAGWLAGLALAVAALSVRRWRWPAGTSRRA